MPFRKALLCVEHPCKLAIQDRTYAGKGVVVSTFMPLSIIPKGKPHHSNPWPPIDEASSSLEKINSMEKNSNLHESIKLLLHSPTFANFARDMRYS